MSPRPLSTTIRVTGLAHRLALPAIVVHAAPTPPLASSIEPPDGGTWTAYAAAHPSASRHMVGLLLEALWRTARLASFDAYLGNPDPFGPARSAYTFRLAPPPAPAAPAVAILPPHLHPFGVLIVSLLLLALLFGGAIVWSRS